MRHNENSKIDYVYTVSYLVWRTYTVYSMSYTAAQKWRLADSSTSHSLCRRNSLFEESACFNLNPISLNLSSQQAQKFSIEHVSRRIMTVKWRLTLKWINLPVLIFRTVLYKMNECMNEILQNGSIVYCYYKLIKRKTHEKSQTFTQEKTFTQKLSLKNFHSRENSLWHQICGMLLFQLPFLPL